MSDKWQWTIVGEDARGIPCVLGNRLDVDEAIERVAKVMNDNNYNNFFIEPRLRPDLSSRHYLKLIKSGNVARIQARDIP